MTHKETVHIKCPTCHKTVTWDKDSPYRPFCSKRCQLIDLGAWANEENRLPSDSPVDENDIEYDPFDKDSK